MWWGRLELPHQDHTPPHRVQQSGIISLSRSTSCIPVLAGQPTMAARGCDGCWRHGAPRRRRARARLDFKHTRLGVGEPVDAGQVRLLRRDAGVDQQQHRRQRGPLQKVRLREGAPLQAVLLAPPCVPALSAAAAVSDTWRLECRSRASGDTLDLLWRGSARVGFASRGGGQDQSSPTVRSGPNFGCDDCMSSSLQGSATLRGPKRRNHVRY